jgi:Uma2 family endonuclease
MTTTVHPSTQIQRFTLKDYLAHSDRTDTVYELDQGELIPMALGTGLHGAIIKFLEHQFEAEIGRTQESWAVLPGLVGIQSPRGDRWDTCRIPDLVVLPKEQWQTLKTQEAVITLDLTPPLLVVEVVSASTKTADYQAKQSEYEALKIPEYWIVDPLEGKVTVLVEGIYNGSEFRGLERVRSPTFSHLNLTPTQILNPE